VISQILYNKTWNPPILLKRIVLYVSYSLHIPLY
jgi:hypothetical protein